MIGENTNEEARGVLPFSLSVLIALSGCGVEAGLTSSTGEESVSETPSVSGSETPAAHLVVSRELTPSSTPTMTLVTTPTDKSPELPVGSTAERTIDISPDTSALAPVLVSSTLSTLSLSLAERYKTAVPTNGARTSPACEHIL